MAKKALRKESTRSVEELAAAYRMQHGGFTVREIEQVVKGIYIPDYAERWVRDSNVYLLGMVEMHVGEFGSGKSTQLMRMGRIFLDAGGLFFYVETEGKMTPAFVRATMGDRADNKRFTVIEARSMGDDGGDRKRKERRTKTEEEIDAEAAGEFGWFKIVYDVIGFVSANCPEAPVLIGVDTVMSAPTEEHRQEFDRSEGQMRSASTKQMRRAKVLKDWLEGVYAKLRGSNVLLACTNHVTEAINLDGAPVYGKPETRWTGGSALGQRSAVIMEYKRGHAGESSVETQSSAVKISVRKNSSGTGKRSLKVTFDYRHLTGEDGKPVLAPNGDRVRVVNWRWDQATVDLLSSFFNAQHRPEYECRGPAEYRSLVKMVETGKSPNKRYSLRAFSEDDPTRQLWAVEDVTAAQLADFIERSAEAQATLQSILLTGVVSHTVYNYLDNDAQDQVEESDGNSDEGSEEE